mmetsp:Transcript_15119/g.53077  ORF Transcript_15119/g.53077 Transcript_15119/m.53077 type:complete len:260 (+) Transcript_15119:4973-5752(+)
MTTAARAQPEGDLPAHGGHLGGDLLQRAGVLLQPLLGALDEDLALADPSLSEDLLLVHEELGNFLRALLHLDGSHALGFARQHVIQMHLVTAVVIEPESLPETVPLRRSFPLQGSVLLCLCGLRAAGLACIRGQREKIFELRVPQIAAASQDVPRKLMAACQAAQTHLELRVHEIELVIVHILWSRLRQFELEQLQLMINAPAPLALSLRSNAAQVLHYGGEVEALDDPIHLPQAIAQVFKLDNLTGLQDTIRCIHVLK